MALQITRDTHGNITHVQSDKHVVITGPVSGVMELSDGTKVNVTDPFVEVETEDHAAELADLIGRKHAHDGHPHDIDIVETTDEETGETTAELVQRPFAYDDSHFKAHKAAKAKGGKSAGKKD